jgi:hypothetical protein
MREIFDVLVPRHFYTAQGLDHFRHVSAGDQWVVPPRPREGRELAFVYDEKPPRDKDESDDLSVVAWTTYLLAAGYARKKDCGWVVIDEAGIGRYFIPIHRTKNFKKHLLLEAQIARCRVRTRPRCPICGTRMKIANGENPGARYWRCHAGHASETWDHQALKDALTPEANKHLLRRRKQRDAWYEKCHKAGKPIRQAVLRRRGWVKVKIAVADL